MTPMNDNISKNDVLDMFLERHIRPTPADVMKYVTLYPMYASAIRKLAADMIEVSLLGGVACEADIQKPTKAQIDEEFERAWAAHLRPRATGDASRIVEGKPKRG